MPNWQLNVLSFLFPLPKIAIELLIDVMKIRVSYMIAEIVAFLEAHHFPDRVGRVWGAMRLKKKKKKKKKKMKLPPI